MNNQITFKYLWTLLLNKKKHLIIGQIITIIAILISIPIPLMLPALVDEVLLNKPDFFVNNINTLIGKGSAFYYIAIVTICVIFLRFIHFLFSAIITKLFTSIAKYITFKIREKLLNHLKNVCMNEYETLGSGAIAANLITDVNTLDNFIITGASKFIASILTLIAVSFVLIAIHPILGLMILIIQPIIMILSKKIAKSVGTLKKEENSAIEKFQNNLGEVLELFGQIKASNKERYFFTQSIKRAKQVKDTSNEFNYKSIAYERFSFTIFLAAFEILRAAGLLMVAYSDLSIGMMFAMFGYIWFIMTPVQDILSMQYSYAQAKAALERINKILELKMETSGNTLLSKQNDFSIELRNLFFSYNSEKETLKNISLKIQPKDKIALIGASGSGKTTLAQIIASFYTKNSGELLYNNIKIEELNKESIRDNIFLVLQMPILFNNTLRFNITMGNDKIDDLEIYKALEIAQLKENIDKMPKGLDTIVGKHGIRLSGGQRQRLSIARMIIANPKVVIFDESTSALDVPTETKLFDALKPILENKTVITIAHRLSTVKNAKKIYVLEEGELVQTGTHEELEKVEGHYTKFVKNQLI
ncbi:ABC transporter ATP-binding protein [Malaciobacter mytili LMG 24559]|uniref:ABC transporter ATP-binding protein n=1 Tax=Malaciobacter mytili LMG 24559 TaxID=1032238 RepID=A0AAX2AG02_9BACT|nr:ABC transporter ATP-binding protein [Malaciobacter mytili]AXH15260.1 ABC transporter, ATP-binding/permease components [Malaciobacter mytili LMG 24559]RXK15659.1 ABC transporter ATP-binding protein [Malaciobacter mytili LMG 24559]